MTELLHSFVSAPPIIVALIILLIIAMAFYKMSPVVVTVFKHSFGESRWAEKRHLEDIAVKLAGKADHAYVEEVQRTIAEKADSGRLDGIVKELNQKAPAERVEKLAGRVHEMSAKVGTIEVIDAKVERLDDELHADLGKITTRFEEHVAEDLRIHMTDNATISTVRERLSANEATQEALLSLVRESRVEQAEMRTDIKNILGKLNSRRHTD